MIRNLAPNTHFAGAASPHRYCYAIQGAKVPGHIQMKEANRTSEVVIALLRALPAFVGFIQVFTGYFRLIGGGINGDGGTVFL